MGKLPNDRSGAHTADLIDNWPSHPWYSGDIDSEDASDADSELAQEILFDYISGVPWLI